MEYRINMTLLRKRVPRPVLWALMLGLVPVSFGLCPLSVGGAAANPTPIRLALVLDRSQYLESEPILLLVRVTNISGSTYRDLGSLEPSMGQLSLHLRASGPDREIHWRGGRSSIAYSGEGIRLGAGQTICELTDVLRCFGEYDPDFGGKDLGVREFYLPPGRYRVLGELITRTGFVHSLPKEKVQADEVEFSVLPLASAPDELELLREHAAECRTRGGSCWNTDAAEAWTFKGVGSHYFYRFFSELGQGIFRISLPQLCSALRSAGAGSATLASVVNWRIDVEPKGDAGKLRWLSTMGASLTGEAEREIIQSWKIRLEQHRFYHSLGP